MPWLSRKLYLKGIKTELPQMPKPYAPNYDAFAKEFEKYKVDKNTVIVAHSCGCAFIVRWLANTTANIKKLILVAPWKIPQEGDTERENFYNYEIDKTIKDRIGQIIIFTSDNEEEDGKKSAEMFRKALSAKVISLKNHGHFTFGDMKTEKFPQLLKIVLEQ